MTPRRAALLEGVDRLEVESGGGGARVRVGASPSHRREFVSPLQEVEHLVLEKASAATVADFIVKELNEKNGDLVRELVHEVGTSVAMKAFKRTKRIEHQGGMECDGAHSGKRKSPGGVWLTIIRRIDGASPGLVQGIIKRAEKRRRQSKHSPDRGTTAQERRLRAATAGVHKQHKMTGARAGSTNTKQVSRRLHH